jgi:hypothetical protein
MYFDRLQAWVQKAAPDVQGPKQVFYFEAFDEPWKQGDDKWGLFNTRQARYAIQCVNAPARLRHVDLDLRTPEANGRHNGYTDAVKWQLPTVSPAITAARYTLCRRHQPVAGEVRATRPALGPLRGTTASYREATGVNSMDGSVQPSRSRRTRWTTAGACSTTRPAARENLSATSPPAPINFQVSSDGYPGKIEIGISTDTEDRDIQEAFLQIAPGDYGYCNNNGWCEVSIPVSAFLAVNPKLDLRW